MIIKGLFKRYARWNPVHPTFGAFWGMGVGIGCGVGWGPGFGPEAIGYVGAGCGIGFSVGITFAGVGIGLPTNIILQAPYDALAVTGRSMLGFVHSSGLLSTKDFGRCALKFQRETNEGVLDLRLGDPLNQWIAVEKLRDMVSSSAKPLLEGFSTIRRRLTDSHKGLKD